MRNSGDAYVKGTGRYYVQIISQQIKFYFRTIGIVIFFSYPAQGYKTFAIWMITYYRLLLYGDINQGIIPKESLQTNYTVYICFIFFLINTNAY